MGRLRRQPGGIHAQRIHARVGENFACEAGEVAVYAAEELVIGGEEGEVPGEPGLVDVGELGECAVLGWRCFDDGSCGGQGDGACLGLRCVVVAVEEEIVFASEGGPLLLGFADDAHFGEAEG